MADLKKLERALAHIRRECGCSDRARYRHGGHCDDALQYANALLRPPLEGLLVEAIARLRSGTCAHSKLYGDREYGTTFCRACHAERPAPTCTRLIRTGEKQNGIPCVFRLCGKRAVGGTETSRWCEQHGRPAPTPEEAA